MGSLLKYVLFWYASLLFLVSSMPTGHEDEISETSDPLRPSSQFQSNVATASHAADTIDDPCQCCFASAGISECSHGHRFCQDCLVNRFSDPSTTKECFAMATDQEPCQGEIDLQSIKNALPPSLAQALTDLSDADPMVISSCHKCGRATALTNHGDHLIKCVHPACDYLACSSCQTDMSDGKSHECLIEKARNEAEEAMTTAMGRKYGIRMCPGCKSPFEKNGGCDRMVCRCTRRFDYSQTQLPSGPITDDPTELAELAQKTIQKFIDEHRDELTPEQLDALGKMRVKPEDMIVVLPGDARYDTVHQPMSKKQWIKVKAKKLGRRVKQAIGVVIIVATSPLWLPGALCMFVIKPHAVIIRFAT